MNSLRGKNAVVTGANRGIGRATVERFAEAGANIWACARKPSDEFESDMKQIGEKHNVRVRPVYFDLSDSEAVKSAVKTIADERATVDVLVNNAGVPYSGMLMMTPVHRLREVFEVNYFSQILMMQLVGKLMIRQRAGAIVNVVSVGGIETNPGYLAYGSSKAALIWATKSVSKELAAFGIRVNGVAPGLTKTAMGMYKTQEELDKVIARSSLRRMAEPSEIVDAIEFLASDRASFITGTILNVDGGRL